MAAGDGVRAAAVDDEGAGAARGLFEDVFGDRHGCGLECVAREGRCGGRRTRGGGEEHGEVQERGILLYAAVDAAEEVAAREEVVWDRLVQVRFGRGGFGCEGRR